MAEANRASSLDGVRPAERTGTPALVLAERRGLALVHVAAHPRRAGFLRSASSALGVALPVEPNTTVSGPELMIFWMGPGRWVIQSENLAATELEDRLRATPDAAGIAIADLSSGWTVIRLCGEGARRILAQGCPIDLHPREFPPGNILHSMLEGVTVMLHYLPDRSGFDLYISRSYGLTVWEWLTEAAGTAPNSVSA